MELKENDGEVKTGTSPPIFIFCSINRCVRRASTACVQSKLFGLCSGWPCAKRTSLDWVAVVAFWFFCAADKRTCKIKFVRSD